MEFYHNLIQFNTLPFSCFSPAKMIAEILRDPKDRRRCANKDVNYLSEFLIDDPNHIDKTEQRERIKYT